MPNNIDTRTIHTDHNTRLSKLEQEQRHNATHSDLKAIEVEMAKIETELKHSASKEDLDHLEKEMEHKHEELVHGQIQLRSRMDNLQGSIAGIKWLIAVGLVAAGVAAPIISAYISAGFIG